MLKQKSKCVQKLVSVQTDGSTVAMPTVFVPGCVTTLLLPPGH